MLAKALLNAILADEALTRGLGDAEARVLVEWLVDRAEERAEAADAAVEVQALCRRGRAIGRFVSLWCHQRSPGAAHQLASAERFTWPLPTCPVDPCELMQAILAWETDELCRRSRKPLAA
jgi:hypothetical protein